MKESKKNNFLKLELSKGHFIYIEKGEFEQLKKDSKEFWLERERKLLFGNDKTD